MFRNTKRLLLVGAIATVMLFACVSQADAFWGCRASWCGWGCYTPCYTSCYWPCYTSCCYPTCYSGCGWGCGSCWSSCCWDTCSVDTCCGETAAPTPTPAPTPAAKPAETPAPAAVPTMTPEAAPATTPLPPEPGMTLPSEPPAAPPAAAPGAPGALPNAAVPYRHNSGLLLVYVPADAKVTVNGLQTRSEGSRRKYVSYGLQPGLTYKYEVRAQVVRDGQPVEEARTVYLTAGKRESVAFGFNVGTTEGLASR